MDRVVGFGDLGNVDDFPTILMARRLIKTGAIKALNKQEEGRVKMSKGARRN